MKKFYCLLSIVLSLFSSCFTTALEIPEPYILAQTIPNVPVSCDECIIQLRQGEAPVDPQADLRQSMHQAIQELSARYDQINEQIYQLESGSSESVTWAQEELSNLLEELYIWYQQNDEEFNSLDQAVQSDKISQDESVMQWVHYIEQLNQQINQLKVEQSDIEVEHQQLLNQLNEVTQAEITQDDTQTIYNQCLLYPYSVKAYPLEGVMLNSQVPLDQYLSQIDAILKEIVPKAYQVVTYEQIYQAFNTLIDESELKLRLHGKTNMSIDPTAYEPYRYAKELSLADIQTVAEFGQKDYYRTQQLIDYQTLYQRIVHLKGEQWDYFHQINQEIFQALKEQLVNYLNDQSLNKDIDIEQVRKLHQKYQLQLAIYDENSQRWQSVEAGNGYTTRFDSRQVLNDTPINSNDISSTTTVESTSQSPMDNHLDQIKERILKEQTLNHPEKPSNSQKPKPQRNAPEVKPNSTQETTQRLKNDQVSLPSTGELLSYTLIGLAICLVGGGIVAINYSKRKAYRKKIDEIELD